MVRGQKGLSSEDKLAKWIIVSTQGDQGASARVVESQQIDRTLKGQSDEDDRWTEL